MKGKDKSSLSKTFSKNDIKSYNFYVLMQKTYENKSTFKYCTILCIYSEDCYKTIRVGIIMFLIKVKRNFFHPSIGAISNVKQSTVTLIVLH